MCDSPRSRAVMEHTEQSHQRCIFQAHSRICRPNTESPRAKLHRHRLPSFTKKRHGQRKESVYRWRGLPGRGGGAACRWGWTAPATPCRRPRRTAVAPIARRRRGGWGRGGPLSGDEKAWLCLFDTMPL
jgi:hypothetical protein